MGTIDRQPGDDKAIKAGEIPVEPPPPPIPPPIPPPPPPITDSTSNAAIGIRSTNYHPVQSKNLPRSSNRPPLTFTAADLKAAKAKLASLSEDFIEEKWKAGDPDSYCAMILDGKLVYLGNKEQMDKLVQNNPELKKQIIEAKEDNRLVFGHMRTNKMVGGDQGQLNKIVVQAELLAKANNQPLHLFHMPVGAPKAFVDTMSTSYLSHSAAAIVSSHAAKGVIALKMTSSLAATFYSGDTFKTEESSKDPSKQTVQTTGQSQTQFVKREQIPRSDEPTQSDGSSPHHVRQKADTTTSGSEALTAEEQAKLDEQRDRKLTEQRNVARNKNEQEQAQKKKLDS